MQQTVAVAVVAAAANTAAAVDAFDGLHRLVAGNLYHDWGLEYEGDEGYQEHGAVVETSDVVAESGLHMAEQVEKSD